MSHTTDDFPLADDDSVPNVLDQRGDRPEKKAHPLPREEDQEEKARLIAQILELQNTLEDLNQRVENVRDESTKLRSENQVLGHYIENLVTSSPIFQPTQAKPSSNNGEAFDAYDW